MATEAQIKQQAEIRKRKLRSAVYDMYSKGKDEDFIRKTGYTYGYDPKDIENEIGTYKQSFGKGEVTNPGGPTISAATAVDIGESGAAAEMLGGLKTSIEQGPNKFGPVVGRIRSLNPYDTGEQETQSIINATKQIVGKYLEGGVLRMEDEKKYEKILPKLSDTPEVALGKLENVKQLIESKKKSQLGSLGSAGYDIGRYQQQQARTPGRVGNIISGQQPQQGQVTPQQPQPQQKGFIDTLAQGLNKVGKFTGMQKFGQGIATTLFLNSKEGKDLQAKASNGDQYALEALNSILAESPNAKELIGSAALTALNAASGGTYGAVTGIAAKLGAGSAMGAGYGLAGGMEQNKDLAGIAKSTAFGAATGGALTGVGIGASKTKDAISNLGKYTSEKLYNSALGMTGKQIEKGMSPAKGLIEKGVYGTANKLSAFSKQARMSIDSEIEKNLTKEATEKSGDVISDVINKTMKEFGGNIDQAEIEKVFLNNKLPFKKLLEADTLSIKELNDLRKIIDNKFLGNNKWTSQNPDAFTVSILKNAANSMRAKVQNSNPEVLKPLFKDYSQAIKLDSAMTSELVRPRRLREYGDIAGATAIGLGSGNPLLGFGAYGARKATETTLGQTGVAVGLDRLSSIIGKIKADKAGKLTKSAIYNAIRNANQY